MPSSFKSLPIIKLTILLSVFVLSIPIITIALYALQPNTEVWQHLVDTVLADYIVNSVLLSLGVAFLSGFLGVSTAWLTSYYQFPGHRLLPLLLTLPMAMPAYIIAFTYTGMLDSGGVVQFYLRAWTGLEYGEYWFPEFRNIYGAILMLSLVLYPYVFLMARASFLTQSAHALQVAQTLGLSVWQRFYRVALPLSRPAIVAGMALVMMETLADYGTVQYFGVNTFTTGIFRTWYGLDDLAAAANLSAMLLFFVFLLLALERFSRRHIRYSNKSKAITHPSVVDKQRPKPHKQAMFMLWCFMPVLFAFVIPTIQLGIWAWANLDKVDKEFLILCWNSFYLALITSVLAVTLTFVFFSYNRHLKSNSIHFSFRSLGLGYAIPGIVVAIGVLIPAGQLDGFINRVTMLLWQQEVGLVISGTLVILVFAYLVRFMAVALGSIESGFGKISPTIDDASRSLRANKRQLMLGVHAPLMFKVLLTAILIIFVDVLKELPTTLVLRPFNFNTLAVNAFELASDEFLDEAALPSIFIVLTGIIPVALLHYGIDKGTDKTSMDKTSMDKTSIDKT